MTGPGQRPLPPLLRPGRRLADFIAGDNAELLARLLAIAESPGTARAFLVGAVGTGKSHLLQGVVGAAAERGYRVAYLPLRALGVEALAGLGACNVIAFDDVDEMIGERAREELLMLACNEAGGAALFASRRHVAELPFVLPDLRSRCAAAEMFRLRPLAEPEQRRLVRARAAAVGLPIEDEVLSFLIHRVARDAGRLAAAVDALDAASWQARRRLTIPFVRSVLARLPIA